MQRRAGSSPAPQKGRGLYPALLGDGDVSQLGKVKGAWLLLGGEEGSVAPQEKEGIAQLHGGWGHGLASQREGGMVGSNSSLLGEGETAWFQPGMQGLGFGWGVDILMPIAPLPPNFLTCEDPCRPCAMGPWAAFGLQGQRLSTPGQYQSDYG